MCEAAESSQTGLGVQPLDELLGRRQVVNGLCDEGTGDGTAVVRFSASLGRGGLGRCSSILTISRIPINCFNFCVSGSSRHASNRGTRVEQMVSQISAIIFMLVLLC